MFDNLFNPRPVGGHTPVSYGTTTSFTHDVRYVQVISSKPITDESSATTTGCGCKSSSTNGTAINLNIFGRAAQRTVEEPINRITVDYTTRLSQHIEIIAEYIAAVTGNELDGIKVKLGLALNEKLNAGHIFDEHCYKHVGRMTKAFVDVIAAQTGFEEDLITTFVTKDLVDYPLPGENTKVTVPSVITSIATYKQKVKVPDHVDPLVDLAQGIARVYRLKTAMVTDGPEKE